VGAGSAADMENTPPPPLASSSFPALAHSRCKGDPGLPSLTRSRGSKGPKFASERMGGPCRSGAPASHPRKSTTAEALEKARSRDVPPCTSGSKACRRALEQNWGALRRDCCKARGGAITSPVAGEASSS
jgi:hypothetical protein